MLEIFQTHFLDLRSKLKEKPNLFIAGLEYELFLAEVVQKVITKLSL